MESSGEYVHELPQLRKEAHVRNRTTMTMATALAATAFTTVSAMAALTPEQRCEAGKNDAAGRYAACAAKAERAFVLTGDAEKYASVLTKCEEKLLATWAKLEAAAVAAGTTCPSIGDRSAIEGFVDACVQTIASAVAGGPLGLDPITCASELTACQTAPVCGDGAIDAGEDCEVANLGSATCATQGFAGGTLACAPGCTFDNSKCYAERFDASGATVIDHQTGLEWEKKDNPGGAQDYTDPHDVDNSYTWNGTYLGNAADGTAFTDFLSRLNGSGDGICYLGHCDWRLPTLTELLSIAVPSCGVPPCVVDPAFLPTMSGYYWSSSTVVGDPPWAAWNLYIDTGSAHQLMKQTALAVRAVRGGS